MKPSGWVWFLSRSLRSWDIMSLGLVARQLSSSGIRLTVISQSGFFPGGFADVISWRGLDGFDRAMSVAFRGRLWHLWGQAPKWWPVVRARATTVHSFKGSDEEWQGHPAIFAGTGLFSERNAWTPAFERDLSWGKPGEDKGDPIAMVVFPSSSVRPDRSILESLQRGIGMPLVRLSDQTGALPVPGGTVDESDAVRLLAGRARLLVLPGVDLSSAILAGFASLYGVPTLAPWSPLLDDLLGVNGYLTDKTSLSGENGRIAAAAARHRLSEHFTSENSAESLQSIYRTVTGSTQ
ncbi:glycosyltransferase [Dethiosulfovibrio salsuginis]|uniref:Uncharacterized protein n=1 Tax=Dethiosulfovibrio salsuginis TaxID=561720 RepID=A0A1X7JXP1_9BACT|nr:glycosyltransferase [Dethiosulfovibrio salsuginis]SMG32523.1 hypothetical protein SAMN06275492_11735 [Dethiosulfovibrio salsuginis]